MYFQNDDLNYLYFIEPNKDSNKNKLVKFDFVSFNRSYPIADFKTVLNEEIIDFVYSNGFLFEISQSKVNF